MENLIPVLLYHSVADQVAPGFRRWSVPPDVFAAHMSYLREHRYAPITVTQLASAMDARGLRLPERPIVITFDDGLADFYSGAWPILRRYGFSSTLYIVTGYVGSVSRWLAADGEGERQMMDWAQVAEVCADGVECGAHSHSHPQLDTLSLVAARGEIVRSREELEEHLDRPVTSFAYPHGYYSPAVRRMVQEAGYSSACGVKHAVSTLADDRFALARIIVSSNVDVESFGRLLVGQGLLIAPHERMQTKMWRWYRRSAALVRGQPAHVTALTK
jgi:peptidoglycan/xylan/chitin deacetylase (PgdA/CDA1 family)